MYFVGIDAGTTCIKAALADEEGIVIDIISKNVTMITPFEGACEIDMVDLWYSLCAILNELKIRYPDLWNKICGIGITGQGDGFWAIDKNGSPVRNAMLWNDTRTKSLTIKNIEEINNICIDNIVNPVFSGSNHMLLKWLKENERNSFNRVYRIFHCKDWLNYKLTGEINTDYTDATTSLMNIVEKKFVDEVLDAMDLNECKSMFAQPASSLEITGSITKAASICTGLKEGIPVICGAIDVAAVAVGLKVINKSDVCTIVGTTLCNEMVIEADEIDFNYGLSISHILDKKYMKVLPTLSGASTIDWVKGLLFPDSSYREIEKEFFNNIPIGSNGVIYHPYIFGERAPFKNPFACGGFYGIKSTHTKWELLRAAFEGLAMSLYDCFESLPSTSNYIYISGGASKSDILCQMFADALGKTIIRTSVKELGISGIISTLRMSLGVINNFESINVHIEKEFKPDLNEHEKYINLYSIFNQLRKDMEPFWLSRGNLIEMR